MTDFFIKSTVCMSALLTAYHIFLKREKIHLFNRFYLLFALILSFVAPLINIEIVSAAIAKPMAVVTPYKEMIAKQAQGIATGESINYVVITLSLYALITLLLLVKFIINIHHFIKKIRKNTRIPFGRATLVLVEEEILPHTFLTYIFFNKKEYEHNVIENELYTHELTHVEQKHTIDILFVEVLKIIFWFNPLMYFYKKAIQLNHEFLADEKVINSCNDTIFYQKLLLEKAEVSSTFYLASNLTYSITKQRLLMMTKSTSKTKSLLLKAILAPTLIVGLFLMMSLKKVERVDTHISNGISTPVVHPSEQQWNDWIKDPNTIIWINNWQMKKADLDQFTAADLLSYSDNYIKKGTNKDNPNQQEVFLYTKQGFEDHYNSLKWPKPIEYKEIQKLKIEEGC